MEVKDTNPYVAVAAKKQRNLKKKLEKIVKFEGQLAAGKALDEEQLALVHSKKNVEKAFTEITAIKTQLEEVAKSLENGVEDSEEVVVASETVVSERHVHTHTVTTSEQLTTEVQIDSNGTEEAKDITNTEDYHMKVVQYAVSTMTETDVDEVVVNASAASAAQQHVDVKAEQDKVVYKLLKALHVYNKYKDVTGSNLPDEFDFFVKTLLGQTFISQFSDALNNSCRSASNFVNGDLSEVIRGLSYADMGLMVEQLADEIEGRASSRGSADALTALLRNSLSIASEPVQEAAPEEDAAEAEYEEEEIDEEEDVELKFGVDEVPASFNFNTPAVDSFNVDNDAITGFTVPAEEEDEEVVEEVKITTTTTTTTTEEHIVVIERDISAAELEGATKANNKQGFKKNKRNNKKFDKESGDAAPVATEEGAEKPALKKRDFKKKEFHNKDQQQAGEGGKKHFKKHTHANNGDGQDATPTETESKPGKPKSFLDSVRSNLPQQESAAPSPETQQQPHQQERKPFNRENRHNNHKKFEHKNQEQQQDEATEGEQKPFVRREKKFFNKDGTERSPRTPKPVATEAAAPQPAAAIPEVDDGFQQPRRHVENQAKKAAKKAAEQTNDRPQQPRPFKPHHQHQKSDNAKTPVPVSK